MENVIFEPELVKRKIPPLGEEIPGFGRYAAYDDRKFPVQLDRYRQESPLEASYEVFWNVLKVKVRRPLKRISESGRSWRRGLTIGFSRPSQNRLTELIRMVARDDVPYLLTLTPECNMQDSRIFKRWLHRFHREFSRQYPDTPVVWRLEFQKRGAFHYHLLIWYDDDPCAPRLGFEDELWIKNTWMNITGANSPSAFERGAQLLDPMNKKDAPKIINYMAKVRMEIDPLVEGHTVKGNQIRDDIHTGRYWGVWCKDELKLYEFSTGILDKLTLIQLRRIGRRYHASIARKYGFLKKAGTKYFQRYLKRMNANSFKLYIPCWEMERLLDFLGISRDPPNLNPILEGDMP